MVDVVANHMGDGDISTFSPFSNASFYHDCSGCPSGCSVTDYNDEAQMEHCRLAGLLDLNQTDAQAGPATGLLLEWIRDLVQARARAGRVAACEPLRGPDAPPQCADLLSRRAPNRHDPVRPRVVLEPLLRGGGCDLG